MMRIVQSPWLISVVGGLAYLLTTGLLLKPAQFAGVREVKEAKESPNNDPSWKFRNPELSQWVEEIRREKESLALREQQLRELATRLDAERQELSFVTQTVHQLQMEFDQNVIRIKEQEVENLKRQAKVVSGMSPEGAAAMLAEMPDDDVVRILATMKLDEVSLVLDSLTKRGKEEAKRAAAISELLRHTLPPPKTGGRATPPP